MSLESIAQDVNDTRVAVGRIEERVVSIANLLEKQNGRISDLEDLTDKHSASINWLRGGIAGITGLGIAAAWLKAKLGL